MTDGVPDDKRACQNCGHVPSYSYWRVFSGNDGVLPACLECMSDTEMRELKTRGDLY